MSMMHRVKHGETNKKVVGWKESLKQRVERLFFGIP